MSGRLPWLTTAELARVRTNSQDSPTRHTDWAPFRMIFPDALDSMKFHLDDLTGAQLGDDNVLGCN